MTNYNDGKWHGWNGGECPVHPETVVEWVTDDMTPLKGSHASRKLDWARGTNIVAFRVIKEYKEPREFWIVMSRSGHAVQVAESKEVADEVMISANGRRIIHVREVLPE